MAKDNFSAQSKAYALFRPAISHEVYAFVLQYVNCFDLAWDVGTGNGQAAVELAKNFKQVVATDISEGQLSQAVHHPNIVYRKEPAEASSLQNNSVDLIVIAQALHWFDFNNFYKEVRRVAKPGAVVAAFSYSMFHAKDKQIDDLFQQFYQDSAPYWDAERKYVDEHYKTIPFPFQEIEAPVFYLDYAWTLSQLLGYIATWSANQHHLKQTGKSLVTDSFRAELQHHVSSDDETIELRFPVHIRMGKC